MQYMHTIWLKCCHTLNLKFFLNNIILINCTNACLQYSPCSVYNFKYWLAFNNARMRKVSNITQRIKYNIEKFIKAKREKYKYNYIGHMSKGKWKNYILTVTGTNMIQYVLNTKCQLMSVLSTLFTLKSPRNVALGFIETGISMFDTFFKKYYLKKLPKNTTMIFVLEWP